MNALYQTIGISKQAVDQYSKRQQKFDAMLRQLLYEADDLRREHPGCGVEKMYYTLKPDFIGRDRFIDIMMELGYGVVRQKNYRRTTYSSSIYYPNMIKGLKINEPGMVWQSDITYISIKDSFYYAVFIIDVYTKKIVGHRVSNHMRAHANVKALEMAITAHRAPKIHHSDRGSQYVYKEYIGLLKSLQCTISMALCAQDNAYAERINRTIKEEYLQYWNPCSLKMLQRCIDKAVNQYNTVRPHNNLDRKSPVEFEKYWATLPEHQRPVTTIFNDELLTKNGQH